MDNSTLQNFTGKIDLILASGSPRRRELLAKAGYDFQVMPADIDEVRLPDETPEDFVKRLSAAKAAAVSVLHPQSIVLGADTIVVLDGRLYGKPADMADAERMLGELSGRTHQVLTGVAMVKDGKILENWVSVSKVTFRTLVINEIREYFSKVNPLDKAGSYGYQHHGEMIVEKFEGLKTNIIGLPIEEVVDKLNNICGE